MPALLSTRFLRTTLMAAGVGLAGAHAPAFATQDLAIVVVTCPQAAGRDPSAANVEPSRNCGVQTPDDLAATPTWRRLELLALDGGRLGRNVTATLNCMSRTTGAVTRVAVVTSLYAPDVPKTASTTIPTPLAFGRCAYFIHVGVDPLVSSKGLMVVLRN